MTAVVRAQADEPPRAASGGTLLGVVFCGGASRRMGRDKATLELGGRTLLERAVDVLRGIAPDVVLASGTLPRYAHLGLEEVLDRRPGGGPLAGLEAALERAAAADPQAWVLALACDMPRVEGELFRHLLAAAEEHGWDGCALATDAGLEPLLAVYSARCLPAVRRALDAGERRMVSFHRTPGRGPGSESGARIGLLRVEDLPRELARREPARNVNTPEDFAREERP